MREATNNEVVVVCVAGIPCSGKSEICRNLDPKWVWIEYDKLEAQYVQESTPGSTTNPTHSAADESSASLAAWRKARSTALEMLEETILHRSEGVSERTPFPTYVVLDDTFHLRSMRKNVLQVCLRHCSACSIYFGVVWVETSLATCLDRSRKRTRAHVNEDVIRKLAHEAERPVPQPSHGQSTRETACLHVSGETEKLHGSIAQVRDFVLALKETTHPLRDDSAERDARAELDRRITQESSRHSLDLLLRRCVKAVASCYPSLGRASNQARQSVLSQYDDQSDVSMLGQATAAVSNFWFELCQLPEVKEWEEDERQRVGALVREAAI